MIEDNKSIHASVGMMLQYWKNAQKELMGGQMTDDKTYEVIQLMRRHQEAIRIIEERREAMKPYKEPQFQKAAQADYEKMDDEDYRMYFGGGDCSHVY